MLSREILDARFPDAVGGDLSENLVAGLQAAVHGDASALKNCGDAELKRIGAPLDSSYERHA
jgi:hypothetical protein